MGNERGNPGDGALQQGRAGERARRRRQDHRRHKGGTYDVFTGPISDQTGKERVAKGQRMEDKDLLVMDWYVKGVQS